MKKHVIKFKGHRKLFKRHSRKLKKMAMMTRMSRGTGFLGHHHHHGHHGHDFPWIGFSGVGFHERRLSKHHFPGSDGFKRGWHDHGDYYGRGKHDHHTHGPHKPYHRKFHGFCKFGRRGPNLDTENDQGMDAAEKSSKLPTPICSAENSQGVDVTERADVPERPAESRAPDVRKSEFPGRRGRWGKGKYDHHVHGPNKHDRRKFHGFRKYMRRGFHHDTESDPGMDAAESSSSSSSESSSSDFSKLWFHGRRGHCGKKQHGHHKYHHHKFHGFCKFGQYARRHDAEIDQGTDGAERSSMSPTPNFCAENSQDVDVPEKSTESRAPDVCKSAFPGRRGHCDKRKPDHHGHGPHKHDHRKFHGFWRCGRRGFHRDAGSDPGMDVAESSSSSSSDSSSSDFCKLWFHGRRGHFGERKHDHKHHHRKFHGFCKFGQYRRRHEAEIDQGMDGAERSSESPNPNRCPENNQGMNAPEMQEDTAAPNGDAESNQAMDVSETLDESPAPSSGAVEPSTSKD